MSECTIQPCESLVRWHLEHRGFTPTHAYSCRAHLSEAADRLITAEHGGVVVANKWGAW